MIACIDSASRLFEVFTKYSHVKIANEDTSRLFKSDYILCNGSRGNVYLVGEETIISKYTHGQRGKDPAYDNISKTT
jgi:hypothetical protein